jgi:hypothetical protein
MRDLASAELARTYWRLFVNRRAYTLQSRKPDAKSGRYFFFLATNKNTGKPSKLTLSTIRRHLSGELTMGLYAIDPSTQRSKWMAMDADYKNALEDLVRLQDGLTRDGLSPALEMSRRGAHLWLFCATPLLARQCRRYLSSLARRLSIVVRGAGSPEGIEIFPKQDAVLPSGFGSALRGPLGIHRAANRRYWFYGAAHKIADQLEYLDRLHKITEQKLETLTAGVEIDEISRPNQPGDRVLPRYPRVSRTEFRILDHVGRTRRVGRNYVTRCPSCAQAGCDRSGDNLAIRIDDPRFYKCWAGCTKEMIRTALGLRSGRPEDGSLVGT